MADEMDLTGPARAGRDPAALAQLYDRYAPRMYRYLYRRVSGPALAEDLTGELFLRLVQATQHGLEAFRSPEAWLYRVAHNLVVDHYRRQPAACPLPLDESLVAEGESPARKAERTLEGGRLRDALDRLTPEQQEVLVLRYGEGMTAKRVGDILTKSTGAVEALQRRGLAALRRMLSHEGSHADGRVVPR